MNQTSALFTVIAISVFLSSITVFAIYQPLHRLLEAVCPLGFTAEFWTRAAVTVIYLMPLWVVLTFGLPDLNRVEFYSMGEVARRGLSQRAVVSLSRAIPRV